MDAIKQQLKTVFHYDSFQRGQKAIIEDVISGKGVLGILPTGSGKSLCYQLPATILPGLTIVVSPLISLMVDQVRQIRAFYFKEAAALHSFIPYDERRSILQNLSKYRLLFVSPELLQQKEILKLIKQVPVSLFCIDEAHCISQWGFDFRPDYLRLKDIISDLNNPTVLALTGTATPQIQNDILKKLNLPNMYRHVHSMERTNIILTVDRLAKTEEEKRERLLDYLNKLAVPAIIYFSSRNMAEEMTFYLMNKLHSARVAFYHAGMETADRLKVQEQFIHNQIDIICSTSAFGMGINKSDIRTVIHYHIPAQLESFMQEIGRAGRDGEESISLLLYKEGDSNLPLSIIKHELPDVNEINYVFNRLSDWHQKGTDLPGTKAEIEQSLQLSETKWRLLYYQLERHGIVKDDKIIYDQSTWKKALTKIIRFCLKRKEYKMEQFNKMMAWMLEERCLREQLYNSFQQDVNTNVTNCCSNCGYIIESQNIAPLEINHFSEWQDKLKAKLLIEDI